MSSFGAVIPLVLLGVVVLVSGLKILREYERAVIFRLGRLVPCRGPGIIYVIPLVEQHGQGSLADDHVGGSHTRCDYA